MNAIMGFSDLLVNNYNNKPKLERFAEIIKLRCADLLDIINDILDIAKIESGQLPLNYGECNLNSLFSELFVFFTENKKKLDKVNIDFKVKLHPDILRTVIVTDTVKLKQILINLISNAFKFTDTGSVEAGCKINDKDEFEFYVSDTGIGIPFDKQKDIFERFTQLNYGNNKWYGGSGLGLSIVKGLVNLLGGDIRLESGPGKGSVFSFTIRCKISDSKEIPSVQKNIHGEFNFTGKSILIAEDDYYNAEYLKEVLTGTGLILTHTAFGKEAIDIVYSGNFDIILMDINLPDINGYEAIARVRDMKPGIKIIAQTAYAAHEDRQKALNAGCLDYISKPIKKELLLNMINKHLITM